MNVLQLRKTENAAEKAERTVRQFISALTAPSARLASFLAEEVMVFEHRVERSLLGAEALRIAFAPNGALAVEALSAVPRRVLSNLADAVTACFGELRPDDEVLFANIRSPEGTIFSLGIVVAGERVRRIFDPLPFARALQN